MRVLRLEGGQEEGPRNPLPPIHPYPNYSEKDCGLDCGFPGAEIYSCYDVRSGYDSCGCGFFDQDSCSSSCFYDFVRDAYLLRFLHLKNSCDVDAFDGVRCGPFLVPWRVWRVYVLCVLSGAVLRQKTRCQNWMT